MKTLLRHLAELEHEETRTHRRSFLKLSISLFLFFFVRIPGQNCITWIIYTKGKSLKEKEKKYTILVLMGYMGPIWHDMAILQHEEKGTHRRSVLKARPNDKCWATQHVGWTNILSFGHRVWWRLNMLDDVRTCLMQYQTFDPTSPNISFVLMLDAWNFVRLAGLNNMLHARTCIRTP